MAKSSKKPDGDGDGVPPWADKDDNNPDVQEEGIFAPNHYCVHHGGVHMEGKIKLGKVIAHNWNRQLQKVTKYDMQFEDGTIVENIKAEDILVTEASLEEMHYGHEVKDDELTEAPSEVSFKYEELPRYSRKLADKLGIKGPFLAPVGDGTRKSQLRAIFSAMQTKVKRMDKNRAKQRTKDLQDRVKEKTFLGSPALQGDLDTGPEMPEIPEPGPESKPKKPFIGEPKKSKYENPGFKELDPEDLREDEDPIEKAKKKVPELAKKAQEKARKGKAEKEAKEAAKKAKKAAEDEKQKKDLEKAADRMKKVVDKSKKNENWSKGSKDELLFERLIKKWAK